MGRGRRGRGGQGARRRRPPPPRRLVLFYDPAGGAAADATGDAFGRLAAATGVPAARLDAARWPRAARGVGVEVGGAVPCVAAFEGGEVVGVTPRGEGRAATSAKGLGAGLGVEWGEM